MTLVRHSQHIYQGIDLKKGLTLIELTIVIAFFSVLAGVISWMFVTTLRSWDSGLNRARIRQESNAAMGIMMREIGQASSITDAAADEITFEADLDDDGGDETVTYSVSGTNLVRTVDAVDTIVLSYVDSLTLSYRDVNDASMSIPSDVSNQAKRDTIRVVTVSMASDRADETFTLSSSVYVRNQP